MKLIKAIWFALVDVFNMYKMSPKVICELFWSVLGVISLALSLVLFPLIVWRKYKNG